MPNPVSPTSEPKHQLFHAYCINPPIRFESQFENEEVKLMLRAHPVTQIPWILTAIFMLALTPLINIFVVNFFNLTTLIFLDLFWLGAIFSFILVNIMTWLFNVGIITNERVVDVDYHNVLYREVTATEVGDITDATATTGGFIQSIFHFGNVILQIPGSKQNIEFIDVPNPISVVSFINQLMPERNQ